MEIAARRALSEQMARLARGDRSAFPSVFRTLQPIVARFAHRMLGDGAAADDAAQQALLDVFENASEYDPSRDALTWVLGIAAYKCRTIRKKEARKQEAPAGAEPEDDTPSPEHLVERQNLVDAVEAVLGLLGPQDREAILAAAGLVERPDVKPATFRKRLERALGRFRRAWGARHGAE